MALNVCAECTTQFAAELDACPHCGGTDFQEDGMAKISVAMGPSNAVTGEGMPEPKEPKTPEATKEEVPVEGVPAESEDLDEGVSVYADWSLIDLQDACVERGLAKSGTKAELAERLSADDERTPEPADETPKDVEPAF
jgi:hypothetical protein